MTLDYWRNEEKDIYLSYDDGGYYFETAGHDVCRVTVEDLDNLQRSIQAICYPKFPK